MKSPKKRIGIIGAGMIAQDHARNLAASGRCTIAAIADINPQAAQAVADKHGIPKIFTDYRAMLDEPTIDAVLICTPPFLHKRMFIDALDAGKHVLIEKPLATTRTDCATMLRARRAHPRLIVCEASCRHSRLQPKFRLVKKIIDSGALGEIYHIHHNAVGRQARPGIEYHPAAKWFLNKKLAGGGIMIDCGVYDLSFHLGLLGDRHSLKSLQSFVKQGLDSKDPGTPVFDVEEHGCVLMKFDHGLSYYWERASHANNEAANETRIYGTKGGIKLSYCTWEPPEISFFDVSNGGKGKARTAIQKPSMKSHSGDNKALDEHFLDCLECKAKPAMPVELAAKHLDIIFKALNSKH
jgi:predicted dehydrogenase